MQARPYQADAIDKVFELFKTHPSILACLATALGKTVIFSLIAKRFLAENPGKRVMVLAERSKIVKQAHKTIGRITGKRVDIEMADHHVDMHALFAPDIVVGTVQTQARGGDGLGRIGKFDPLDFGLIIVDECHHAVNGTYRRILDYYRTNPDVRILGVTATPDRSDKKALGKVFDAVACDYDIRFGYEEGWLLYPHQQFTRIKSLDISHVGKVAGDFNAGELADALEGDKPQYEIAKACVDLCGDKKTIVFAVRVSQASDLTDLINSLKPNSARFVHGGTPECERDQLYHDYAVGAFQYLVNVGITVEGFDDPGVERIVDAAMTMSRAKYTQKLGRMLRPAEAIAHALNDCASADERRALIASSAKPTAVYIDLIGNSGRHKPVFVGDILGGDYSDDVRAKARAKAEKAGDRGEAVDIDDLLRKAKAEEDIAKARAAARRAALKVKAEYSTTSVDPFNAFDIKRADSHPTNSTGKRLTDKQKAILDKNGIKGYEDLPIADAKKLIDRIIWGYQNDMCTLKMQATLKRFGYGVPLKRVEGKRILDAEFARRNAR